MKTEKRNSRLVANIVFFLVVIISVITVIFNLNDINEIIKLTKTTKIGYLLFSVFLVIIHMCLTNISFYIIQKNVENNLSFNLAFNISNTEYLFNAVTPFASGGQPIQAYYLVKNGMTGEESASVLVANFTLYQFVLTLFSTLGVILYFNKIYSLISNYVFVVTIGFIINALILIGLILIARVSKFKNLVRSLFRLLGKIKFLNKSMTNLENKTFTFIENFQSGTKYLLSNKKIIFDIILIRLIDLIIYFSVPVYIFLALGINISIGDIWFIVMMTAFSATFMMWIPTPGATGGVEWAFTILFVGVIQSSSTVVTAMLFWRAIAYFLPLVLGFGSYLIVKKRSEKE